MNIRLRHLSFCLVLIFFSGCVKKNFFSKTPLVDPNVHQTLKQNPVLVDSVIVQAGKHYKRGLVHRIFWGTHYRPVWAAPVKVPVFDMDSTKGGLKIEKLGGGFQTTSLTLVDKNGFTYALRSLDKDPEKVLPKVWRDTFVLNILRDQISAINPYGALVLPPLADAAGILHSTPKLVYVRPNDSSFGEYEKKFSDKLFAIEEKFNSKRAITPAFGKAKDIVSSGTVLNKRYTDDDHFIDQLAFAKARLFDIFVHDWDRHEGQWEWAEYERKGNHYYRPIPKDRDNVFYKFQDGIIPWIFSRNWAIRKFQSFDSDYKDLVALTINSKFIDERALSQVTRTQFDSLANEMQTAITDDVISEGVQNFPKSVYQLVGKDTKDKLISRRNKLNEAANQFYEILAKEVLVAGSDLEDIFEVNRLDDERTEVIVKREDDNNVTYRRTFYRSETKLITLHGLADDDKFRITGKVNKGIKIKIIGGLGEDEIEDTSEVKKESKKTWVYDTKRGTELKAGPTTKDKRKNDVRIHAFDREGF